MTAKTVTYPDGARPGDRIGFVDNDGTARTGMVLDRAAQGWNVNSGYGPVAGFWLWVQVDPLAGEGAYVVRVREHDRGWRKGERVRDDGPYVWERATGEDLVVTTDGHVWRSRDMGRDRPKEGRSCVCSQVDALAHEEVER